MEWITLLLKPATLVLLLPVSALVGLFIFAARRAQRKHLERIKKIRQGVIHPDDYR